jgi:competence protein ComEC
LPLNRPAVSLLVALLYCPGEVAAQAGQSLVVRSTVSSCLLVRSQPAADAAELVPRACLPAGTIVEGIASAPYWRRVRLADGRLGWAAKKFLESAGTPTPADTSRDDAWLEIHVVDVGTGDGVWIHTFDDGIPGNNRFEGRNIVIDGGPRGTVATNAFLKYLKAGGHQGALIDALIVSHPHNDHFPGAQGILGDFEVCHFYDSGYRHPAGSGAQYRTFLGKIDAERCEGAPTRKHMGRAEFGVPDWGSELAVEFLWAYPGADSGLGHQGTLINNSSIVLKLTYGTQSFLFVGDLEGKERDEAPTEVKYGEARLLAEAGPAKLRSTVLKVAHHGSETSSTLPFVQAVDPQIVVVSSGREKYGSVFLPDASTLARYCAHNPAIRIYRTDQDDAAEHRTTATDADADHVVILTNGRTTMVRALSNGVPFSPTACTP